ncbi:MAG TPA: Wzz/FepE/Etk N-terminal domain-containing protein [Usitatibacter sp.]|nr:Wzz/FepE/Etk N-terminal domain-containing protein [Usitatibacter sp.]
MPPSPTLSDYWMAMYRRKWIIVAVALSSAAFAYGISLYMTPVYEAKASFYFPANMTAATFTGASQQKLAQLPMRPVPEEREAGVHVGVLRSRDLAQRVAQRFPQRDAEFFRRKVDFVTSPEYFVDIYVRDHDPQLAAQVANAFVEEFRRFHIEKLKGVARHSVVALEAQRDDLDRRIEAKCAEIRAYQQRTNVLSSSQVEQLNVGLARDLERQRDDVAVEIHTVRARQGRAADGVLPADDLVLSNPRADNLRALEARQAAIRDRLGRLNAGTRDSISTMAVLHSMEGDRKVLQELMVNVELNLAEAKLQSESPNVEVVQVQTAEPPREPGFPILVLNAAVALILGLAAGCYVALLLEYLRSLRVQRAWRNLDESVLEAGAP